MSYGFSTQNAGEELELVLTMTRENPDSIIVINRRNMEVPLPKGRISFKPDGHGKYLVKVPTIIAKNRDLV